jgi:hypothetical protein
MTLLKRDSTQMRVWTSCCRFSDVSLVGCIALIVTFPESFYYSKVMHKRSVVVIKVTEHIFSKHEILSKSNTSKSLSEHSQIYIYMSLLTP